MVCQMVRVVSSGRGVPVSYQADVVSPVMIGHWEHGDRSGILE